MGDENTIRTFGDYSKPSHEGYMNSIELPVGNNVVPFRSDTIRLVQNGCLFHELRSEDPNQHLKDFLKPVDSLDLDGENKERTRMFLFQFSLHDQASNWLERLPAGSITTWEDLTTLPHHGIDLWLQVQIFYDRINHTLKWTVDYAARGRLRKLSAEKAWATIKELARYKDEGWNDLLASGKRSLEYKNPDIEQLLGVMECKVDTLMKEAISLIGRSESIFGMTSNIVYQLPSEPSRQEEFENLVMNFILDQAEKVKQLEEYMGVIGSDFMQLSLEVVGKLKEEIRMKKIESKRSRRSQVRMIEVIKREFEKIKDVKVEDVPLICDASLEVFNDEVRYDPSDVAFIEWLRSKFFNYKTMDHYTMKALWIYWIRGDDEVELTDEESSDNDDEIAEVFRIDTNIFDYETPICSAFNEFNYLLKLTNCGKPTPLLGVRWYEALRDLNKSIEALRNKAIMEGSIKEDDESRYEQKRQWNTYTNYDDAYEINHEHNKSEELCEIQEQLVWNIKRYMMIKYSFNDDEEYVAVKEDKYDDLTVTRKEACRAYQEIFQIMDEGWMVTRAGKKVEAEKKSNLKTSL
ncbi:hypothetical protein Tco_0067561 [Tanacetum coccineum]